MPKAKRPKVSVRRASPPDLHFLKLMWFEAAFWDPAVPRPSLEQALDVPELARYIKEWGRPGDTAMIAEDERPLGAAWYRLFTAHDQGYGFVDESTPELGIAVTVTRRGEGLGSHLLDALCEQAAAGGFERVSLSVVRRNPAVRLYERAGFVVVEADENSWKMVKSLEGTK